MWCSSHLDVLDLGLGQQELLVVVPLPLFPLRLQLHHRLLGVSQPLPEVCDLGGEGRGVRRTETEREAGLLP